MDFRLKLNDPKAAKEYFERKMAFTTGPAELKYFFEQGTKPNVIDVRSREAFAEGHVPGAVNLPEEEWSNTEVLSKERMNVVYCYSVVCHLAARACLSFAMKGYPVMEMDGGFEGWSEYYEDDIEKGTASEAA